MKQQGGVGGGFVSSPPKTQRLAPEKQHNVVFFVVFFLKTVFIVLFAWRHVWGATDNICIHLDNSYICANTNKKGY